MLRQFYNILAASDIAWSAFKFLFDDKPVMMGPISLGPAEYFALAIAGMTALAILNWQIVTVWRANRPKEKFKKLNDKITLALGDLGYFTKMGPLERSRREELRAQFQSLKISPPSLDDEEKWTQFLIKMKVLASGKRLKEAREFSRSMRA